MPHHHFKHEGCADCVETYDLAPCRRYLPETGDMLGAAPAGVPVLVIEEAV